MVDQSMRDREIPVDTIGYAGRCANTSPPVTHDDNSNHRGLNWEYQGAAANPAGASRLQSLHPVRRVAELGSLGDFALKSFVTFIVFVLASVLVVAMFSSHSKA